MRRNEASAFLVAVLVASAASGVPRGASAQPSVISFGVAAGSPGGVSFAISPGKTHRARPTAVHALASFDLDDYFLGQAYRVSIVALPESPVTLFAGPGIAAGLDDGRVMTGVGAVAGLRFFRARYEIFVQAQPRLMALPDLTFQPGGAVGFRVHP